MYNQLFTLSNTVFDDFQVLDVIGGVLAMHFIQEAVPYIIASMIGYFLMATCFSFRTIVMFVSSQADTRG